MAVSRRIPEVAKRNWHGAYFSFRGLIPLREGSLEIGRKIQGKLFYLNREIEGGYFAEEF